MTKPTLHYLIHTPTIPDLHQLVGATTFRIASRGTLKFRNDSEVLYFSRSDWSKRHYFMAGIFPVDEKGTYVHPWYDDDTRKRDFHERNRGLYQEAAKSNELLVFVDSPENGRTGVLPYDMQGELKRVVELYIAGNPRGNTKLAVLNTSPELVDTTLETFRQVVRPYASLREIKLG